MEDKKIHFNKYGMIAEFPKEINDAQCKYWSVIEPYLNNMTPVEVRAFLFYINLDSEMSVYMIKRSIAERKREAQND